MSSESTAPVPAIPQGGPPPGWYADQSGRTRWWDGVSWTEHYAPTPAQPQVVQFVRHPDSKSTGIAYLFLLLLGGFGAHHFYLGRPIAGVVMLFLWNGGLLFAAFGGAAAVSSPSHAFSTIGALMLFAAVVWFLYSLFSIGTDVRRINGRLVAPHAA